LTINSCFEIHADYPPYQEGLPDVPDTFSPEDSPNDPHSQGCNDKCVSNGIYFPIHIDTDYTRYTVPAVLPASVDLSSNMPPIRSQGQQGSCVAWTVGYYLKSYQEKIQHGYDYTDFSSVMSPAYVYNQVKESGCASGSSMENSLEILKNQGIVSWQDFPYSDEQCSILPNQALIDIAADNKISAYYELGIPSDQSDPHVTLINIMKALLAEGRALPSAFDMDPYDDQCGHAQLIVGYDDARHAFKRANSWGTYYGDNGYDYIDYKYFLPSNNPNFEVGLLSVYVTYDE